MLNPILSQIKTKLLFHYDHCKKINIEPLVTKNKTSILMNESYNKQTSESGAVKGHKVN